MLFHVGDLALEDVLGARNAGVPVALINGAHSSLFPSFPPDLLRGGRNAGRIGSRGAESP